MKNGSGRRASGVCAHLSSIFFSGGKPTPLASSGLWLGSAARHCHSDNPGLCSIVFYCRSEGPNGRFGPGSAAWSSRLRQWHPWRHCRHVCHSVPSARVLAGTFSISASAVVFLLGISWLGSRRPVGPYATAAQKDADRRRENLETLFLLPDYFSSLLFACATWINPDAVGRSLGSMVVAHFFGAILAWSTPEFTATRRPSRVWPE
jgi:hypothetical protein